MPAHDSDHALHGTGLTAERLQVFIERFLDGKIVKPEENGVVDTQVLTLALAEVVHGREVAGPVGGLLVGGRILPAVTPQEFVRVVEDGPEGIELESRPAGHYEGAEGDELAGESHAHPAAQERGPLIKLFREQRMVNAGGTQVEPEQGDRGPVSFGEPEERAQIVEVANLQFPQGRRSLSARRGTE